MVQRTLVSRVNSDLHALDAKAHGETPVVQGLLDALISLTEFDPSAEAAQSSGAFGAKKDAAAEHVHVADVFGNCVTCKQCMHQSVNPDSGVCKNCGEEVGTDHLRI